MDNIFDRCIEALNNRSLDNMQDFIDDSLGKLIDNIKDCNIKGLNELKDKLCLIDEKITRSYDVEENQNFYLGYLYAFESVAGELAENYKFNNEVEIIMHENPKLYKAIEYLGENEFETQGKLAEYLEIKQNHLWNILNKKNIKQLNLFVCRKIGRNVLYSLSYEGKEIWKKMHDKSVKTFSKDQELLLKTLLSNDKKEIWDYEKFIINIGDSDLENYKNAYSIVMNNKNNSQKYDSYIKSINKKQSQKIIEKAYKVGKYDIDLSDNDENMDKNGVKKKQLSYN